MRERGVAQALLELYGDGQTCLQQLCESPAFSSLAIYEPGVSGVHRPYLQALPHYRQSCYRKQLPRGASVAGLVNQDLEQLTYEDSTFDVVVTSDILEHVRRPSAAFGEIRRVLKLGGRHVFTVPLQYPMPRETTCRVDTSTDVDRPVLPPTYHGDGDGGRSLVYTDFGEDMLEQLERSGMEATFRFVDATNAERRKVVVFVARKVALE